MRGLGLLIFVAGVVCGAITLPATLIYVKPIRTKLVNKALDRAKDRLATAVVENPELRRELITKGSDALIGLIAIERIQNEEGK
ncbi:membrane protein [Arthrobacter phage CastorTray]|uniref:Membrane protein n=1 Tax=Arthrobacter phage CastorTray TaxID=2859632 RepID=A0AAE7WDY2_9CAUD|nr:membrane protein [Arthrobacter phage CastorTray]QYC55037.1 membrane protein [Arthrobacter phage CastorTray]